MIRLMGIGSYADSLSTTLRVQINRFYTGICCADAMRKSCGIDLENHVLVYHPVEYCRKITQVRSRIVWTPCSDANPIGVLKMGDNIEQSAYYRVSNGAKVV